MTQQQIELIKKELEDILEANVWGLVCEDCGGGGADGQDKCSKCNGTGVYNWHYDLGVEKISQLFEQKLREVGELSISADILAIVEEKGIVLIRFGDKVYTITEGINITTADLSRVLTDKSNKLEREVEGTNTKEIVKEMRKEGERLKKVFAIYRGEEQNCCPICGVDLCKLADRIDNYKERMQGLQETARVKSNKLKGKDV